MNITRNRRINRIIALLAAFLLIISQTACSSKSDSANNTVKPVEGENFYLDTVCRISVYDMGGELSDEEAGKVIDAAFDRCRELDKKLSNTVDASEISAINNAGGEWVEVSDDTLAVLEAGKQWGDVSGGKFDITIGTLTDIWDYHADDPVVPEQATIDEALSHVDYMGLEIDGKKVRLTDPESKIDLGGIAKGYIGVQMAEVLESCGVTSAIINLGGNIVAIGGKPDGSGASGSDGSGFTDFVIGVEKPYSDRTELIGSVSVQGKTVVTSGVYERQFEVDGTIYHHILSTSTGYPAETDLDAVTIVMDADRSMDADALSTVCLMLGAEQGRELVESIDGAEAVFCTSDGGITTTSGMKFDPIN